MNPRVRRGGARGLGVGRGGARRQRSGEAELAHLGVDWSCSHALDCSDESMLMVISSSSSGTLVLVPDNRLNIKLNAQIETNLRDEFFKHN